MSEFDRFADLHCHPHMRSFNWLHKRRRPEKDSRYNPWWIILSKQKLKKRANGLSTEKFVKKVCFDNAFDFVTKHFK